MAPPGDAQLLDVRPAEAHLAGHLHGAINVPVSGNSFSTKAGFVLHAEHPVCVLADNFHEAQQAIRGLHSVAFFDIAGYVLGGGDERTEAVTVDELEELLAAGAEVVDVREQDDRGSGHIPGSHSIPYHLLGRVVAEPPDRSDARDDLRDRAPGGDRRQHPPGTGLRRAARARRRHGRLARPRRHDGRARGGATI